MRVTESRMIEMVTAGISRAREQAAESGQKLQTGLRVTRPSDDAAGWEQGMRAGVRTALSERRGGAIGRAHDRLADTDTALEGVGNVLQEVTELAVELANGHYNASDRAAAATQVAEMRASALVSANTRSADGEYLLAGSRGATAPFDPTTGAYLGDAVARQIESGDGGTQVVTVPGSVLTAASGVDVFAVLSNVMTALQNNDVTALQASLVDLHAAVAQVADARTEVGGKMRALDAADLARQNLEQQLADAKARAVEVDPITAAADFARASTALETARTVAEDVIAGIRR